MRPGDRLAGRFEILGDAVRGGSSTVLHARDRKLRRDVAVKLVAGGRFEREAAILASVSHPNIVGYVAHGTTEHGGYLVMDWVDGENLAERLERRGVDTREAIAIAVQLARALGALHAAGAVHRDVKPANVMLLGDAVKLVDFGIARRAIEPRALTRTGTLIGTAGYMAPEQVRGAHAEVTARSDLFALGCVIYECLTGQRVFWADNLLALRTKVLLHDPPPLRLVVPAVPAALDGLVGALLARDPAARPVDAAAVERALLAIGELPAGPPVRAVGAPVTTLTTPSADPVFAVVVAFAAAAGEPLGVAQAIGGACVPFDGGAVFTAPAAHAAAALARALAAALPGAVVAACAGDQLAAAADRAAALIGAAELAAAVANTTCAGAWLDDATAGAVGDAVAVEPHAHGARVVEAGRAS